MDLFQPPSNIDLGTGYASLTTAYAAPSPVYANLPQVYGAAPQGVQATNLPYLPPGLSDVTVQQQQAPTLQVAKGYKWKESTPILVYLALAIAGLILILFTPGSGRSKVVHLMLAIVWTVVWGIFVVLAAKKGKTALAWILAIVPIVLWLIVQILIFIKAVAINL